VAVYENSALQRLAEIDVEGDLLVGRARRNVGLLRSDEEGHHDLGPACADLRRQHVAGDPTVAVKSRNESGEPPRRLLQALIGGKCPDRRFTVGTGVRRGTARGCRARRGDRRPTGSGRRWLSCGPTALRMPKSPSVLVTTVGPLRGNLACVSVSSLFRIVADHCAKMTCRAVSTGLPRRDQRARGFESEFWPRLGTSFGLTW
jgi:hypothetical protein